MAINLKPAITLPIAADETLLQFLSVKTDTGAVYRIALVNVSHGSFGDLSVDDHPQYHTDSRADTWFSNKSIGNIGGVLLTAPANLDILSYDSGSGKWINRTSGALGFVSTGDLASHTGNTSNPHSVTAAQIGAALATRTITAGTALSGGGDLQSNMTINFDLTELSEETVVDPDTDYTIVYDTSAGTHRKVKPSNFPGAGGGGAGGGSLDGGNASSDWFGGADAGFAHSTWD